MQFGTSAVTGGFTCGRFLNFNCIRRYAKLNFRIVISADKSQTGQKRQLIKSFIVLKFLEQLQCES